MAGRSSRKPDGEWIFGTALADGAMMTSFASGSVRGF